MTRRTWRLDGPRAAPITTVLAGVVSAVAGGASGGAPAVWGALLASALVLAFFWSGALPLLLVGADLSLAGVGFIVLLLTYALRLVALLVVLSVASRSDAVDVRWLALTVIACTLVWIGTQVALVSRSRATL